MVAGWEFVFRELGFMVYAGKVFGFGFEWGFWVWLEREAFVFGDLGFGVWLEKERRLREIFFFLVKVKVFFFSEMERPCGGLEKIGRLFFLLRGRGRGRGGGR